MRREMACSHNPRHMGLGLLLLIVGIGAANCDASASDDRKNYIVYMGELPSSSERMNGFSSVSAQHVHMLRQASDINSFQASNLVHSYHKSFNGFVARLTKAEAKRLADMDGVVSVFPSEKKELHTTRSWDFMGFPQTAMKSNLESDIIVGMFDTGVWPESASFDDKGFGPPPAKWKGSCQSAKNFTCNNKLIGAKAYQLRGRLPAGEEYSPRDIEGHGTHTSSTAAGNSVVGASLYGLGSGTARGGVPSARIAMYKVCWSNGCYDQDILAAFDDAISDGVDLISLSLGSSYALNYFEDSIAIGAFHSMKNGILVSNSGGNSGPKAGTITNVSPWSLTVAANSIDRKFVTDLQLGSNATFQGISINTFSPPSQPVALIYAGDAPNKEGGYDGTTSRFCYLDSLDPELVKDKIVLCDSLSDGSTQFYAGAAGTVMQDSVFQDTAMVFPLPATYLTLEDGAKVGDYINNTENPTATISKTTSTTDSRAPVVASFSSRGPNTITSDILKPDLTAPGIDILAAWSDVAPLSGVKGDDRKSPYNIISGTSMSCPHVTGAAAYVKSFHPTWSPAAIKSALMTTAIPMSSSYDKDAEFGYGSGHINPSKAINPGLIYDAGVTDYIKFLCNVGYTEEELRLVTGDNITCSSLTKTPVWDLNYPSFTLSANYSGRTLSLSRSFHRTVTNVGSAVSTYKAVVNEPSGMKIKVEPSVLRFKAVGQKASFVVTVEAEVSIGIKSGSLIWDDGVVQVRSPVVAYAVRRKRFQP